ncbi:MAG: PqqD family protein [Planctomycetota bacterium]|jgi:hypothetical protein
MDISVKWPKRSEDTASRVVDGEAVIVIPQKGVVTVLNETGSGIWQLLDGRNSIEDITNIISSEFDVPREQAEKDTLGFIEELIEKEMVVL